MAAHSSGRAIAWFAARDPFRPAVRTASLAPVASFNGIIVILGLVVAYALQVVFRAAEPPPAAFVYVPASPAAAGSGLLLGSGVPTSTSFVAVTASSASTTPLGAFVGATMAAYCAPSNPPPGAPPSYSARAYSASAAPSLVAVSASGDESPLPLVAAVRTPATDCPALWLSVSFTYDFSAAPTGTVMFCARTPPLLISACATCPPEEGTSYVVSRVAGAKHVEVCVLAGRVAEGIAFAVDTRAELSGPSTMLTPALRAVLLPVGAIGGAVHPARGGNVTITSLPSITLLVAVPSPPSLLNVAALVGAFVLSSISSVGRVMNVAMSAGVQSHVKRVVAVMHAPLLLQVVLVVVAIGLPWTIWVLVLPTLGDLVLDTTLQAVYCAFCALSSLAVLLRIALACHVLAAPEAVSRARRAIFVACAVVSVAGLPTAFTISVVNTGRIDGPHGVNMLLNLVSLMCLPGLVAAALMALVVHETTTARGEVMITSNTGCVAISLLWMWGAAVCTLAYAQKMSSVAEVSTAFGTDPLGTLLGLGGLIACFLGLGTTLVARIFVPADTESSLRRSALLLLLALCAIASVVSATATLTWLVVNANNGLPLGNILFSTWMLACMVAAAAWASHLFIAVDAGHWRCGDALSRGERVVAMLLNPVRTASTAPVVHTE